MGLVLLEEEEKVAEFPHAPHPLPIPSMQEEKLCKHMVSRRLSESQTQSPHQNLAMLTP